MRLQGILAFGLSSVILTACGAHGNGVVPSPSRTDQTQSAQTDFTVVTNAVRRIENDGRAVRFAGTSYMASVHTIPANLNAPNGVTYDPDDGNLYVLDENQSASKAVILRVTPSTGSTSVFVTLPTWFANGITYVHANKTFYVTSQQSPSGFAPTIMAVSTTGTVSTLAGGVAGGNHDGTGASASFSDPTAIAYDTRDGVLYVTDSDRIRRITTVGAVTTTATGLGSGFSQQLYSLTYNGFDGNLYVADPIKNIIQRVTTSGTVTTIAGQCLVTTGSCDELQRDGHGSLGLFAQPYGIAANPTDGALYVADRDNNSIRKINTSDTTSTFAGNGLPQDVDGTGLNAGFQHPSAITFATGSSSLYVLERNQGAVTTAALRSVTTIGTAPPPQNTKISLFDTVTPDSLPATIDWHSSNPAASYLWYTERNKSRIARMTTTGTSSEYSVPTGGFGFYNLFDIELGADGTPWMDFETAANALWHRTAAGAFASYSPASGGGARPDTLTYGPDGNVWFATFNNQELIIGYVSSGTVVDYPIPNTGSIFSTSIAFDAAGTIWVAQGNCLGCNPNNAAILRLSRTGTVLARYVYPADYVTKGPNGNIWFAQRNANGDLIGTINPANGVITTFPLYTSFPACPGPYLCSHGVSAITTGSDGALWFAESSAGAIGRLTTSGAYTEYPVLAARTSPMDVTNGPDGNVWFVDTGAQKIGRVKIH